MAHLSRIDNSESGNTLQVIVTHQDWDSEVGREVHIIGRIVDFEMECHMLQFCKLYIVASLISNTYQDLNFQVTSVSLTSGHQAVQANTNPDAGGTPSASGGRQILDLESLDALIDSLRTFEGRALFITHNFVVSPLDKRDLIQTVVDH
ncbi:hypothetical protein KEM48_010079 [Puccinia striiformis f. sp. tritici PST-130]|nr:hypothetical protein KEM48_010079 [Puccinia striiformis f. sp. tritici PST-130]